MQSFFRGKLPNSSFWKGFWAWHETDEVTSNNFLHLQSYIQAIELSLFLPKMFSLFIIYLFSFVGLFVRVFCFKEN